ncbi:MAG: restriction endonuclease subunit S [Lachnospiraceae bacterium]|nr:restriction endonuclease subunit S [Lachnospiraceae bacterium]
MTPELLKASIFQYAMQGKLVEQRPEEGTADEQFRSIQEEIQRLVNEKKIGKPKRVLPVSDIEPPYEVPDNWKWVRLGLVCNEILVPQRDKPKYFDGDIPWCRIEDIDGKYLNGTKSNQFVSEQTVSSMNLKVNPIGTVISANSASVGEAAICTVRCITNQTFIGLVCNDGVYNEFLYYFLVANKGNIRKLGAGTTILYISQDKYWNMPFPLPPLEEQHRIVAKIEELLPYVDRYAEAYDKLEQFNAKFPEDMKKSILQYAIQGKLVEQRPEEGTAEELYQQIQDEKQRLIKEGKIKKEKPLAEITEDEIPFDIPESWKWVKWGNIVNVVSARRVHQSDWKKEGIPFYRAREIAVLSKEGVVDNELYISEELYKEFLSSGVPSPGDLMVTAVGTLGKTYIVKEGDRFYYKDASVICFENRFGMCPEYLAMLMRSPLMTQQIKSNSDGTTVATLTMARMNEYLMPLPPLEEQHRIVAKIEELLPYCDTLVKGIKA